jgi:hypothetical protein
VPQDSRSNEFGTHHQSLIDDCIGVFSHLCHDDQSDLLSCRYVGFARYRERVDQSLRVCFANIVEESEYDIDDVGSGRLDSSDDLAHQFLACSDCF